MDPTSCLRRIADAATRTDLDDACTDLRHWLGRGGFAPRWSTHPEGAKRYRKWCHQADIVIPASLATLELQR